MRLPALLLALGSVGCASVFVTYSSDYDAHHMFAHPLEGADGVRLIA